MSRMNGKKTHTYTLSLSFSKTLCHTHTTRSLFESDTDMLFCYQIALWVSGECEFVGRTLSRCKPLLMYAASFLIISSRGVRGNGGREGAVDLEEGTQYICKFSEGLLRHPVLTSKTVGAALVEVFAVLFPVEAMTPLSLMLLLISEASMV